MNEKKIENTTDECIKKFAEGTRYFICGGFSRNLIEDAQNSSFDSRNDETKKKYIELLSEIYIKDLEKEEYNSPLIFIITKKVEKEKKNFYIELDISKNGLSNFETSTDYLKKLKQILNLENPIDKEESENKSLKSLKTIIDKDKYVITQDNFRKMILILYRILAKIPVILMGETGCGKTALIKKLYQLLNNDENEEKLKTINIHPGVDDDDLIKKMEGLNEDSKKNPEKEIWVFFDEFNTCNSLSLLTEIFINRTFNGNKLNKNIRIIGACNPYRKIRNKQKLCGLTHPNDDKKLIYDVHILPQSLMYYVFNFSSIKTKDEEKYISSIINELFTSEENEKYLLGKTTKAISECQTFFRNHFDSSVVSLREMNRFTIICKFFIENYYPKKNKYEKKVENKILEKIKSIIISIYICYYIRLVDQDVKQNFEDNIRDSLVGLVNYNLKESIKGDNLFDRIGEPLHSEIENINKEFNNFSQIIELEEIFIMNQIEKGKGIGDNKLLRENLFLLFVSLNTNIPLIIIGKPGSGKSLSVQLICKSMKGPNSNSKFFKEFPSILQSYFQGSKSTTPEDVEGIFQIAEERLDSLIKNNEKSLPISMILFDELGLADKSKYNPLKVLHSKLEPMMIKKIKLK